MWKLAILVFIGGGLGSVARFGVARLLAAWWPVALPLGTFSVNVVGAFLIGLCWGSPIADKQSYIHLLSIGFCGGFTTFSAFSWENFNLLKHGDVFLFFLYALLSVAVCLLATWVGYSVGAWCNRQ